MFPALPAQRREQGSFADHAVNVLCGQNLVVEADHPGAFARDDAAAFHAERLTGGGAVERRGSGRAPVHHQWLPVLVAHSQPADAVGVTVVEVQPAEDDALLLGVQIGELGGGAQHHGVPLDQAADRARAGPAVPLCLQFLRLRAHDLQACVDLVDYLLFDGDLVVCFGHSAPPRRMFRCGVHGPVENMCWSEPENR